VESQIVNRAARLSDVRLEGRVRRRVRRVAPACAVLIALAAVAVPRAQAPDDRTKAYDEALDLYVRDGLVYYRALKATRGRFDGYVNSLASASIDSAGQPEQEAFWLNAYNAFVLQTVLDHYPIAGRSREYPVKSIRQVPGAFERLPHRAAGRTVTLDQIEQTILPSFHDPRLFLALGRGAVGSSRLRSEAYVGHELERQLSEQANECLSHAQCVSVDIGGNRLRASSIFSWREQDFDAAYAGKAPAAFQARSAGERAVIGFVEPHLLTTERDFLAQNQFKMEYIPFDWTLNDLTGR
jgi:hypothetical protein